jgi:hypothetical protein
MRLTSWVVDHFFRDEFSIVNNECCFVYAPLICVYFELKNPSQSIILNFVIQPRSIERGYQLITIKCVNI